MTKPDLGQSPRDEWDRYWSSSTRTQRIYDRIAWFYRDRIIGPTLSHWVHKVHPNGGDLLHAGCGSGGVDVALHGYANITALDFSHEGVETYVATHPDFTRIVQGDIFHLPFGDQSFDGVFNLGVMEHFTDDEIARSLGEIRRVLRTGGYAILFWPPEWGLSVNVLKVAKVVLSKVMRREVEFHPAEINRIRSKKQCRQWLASAGFSLEHYSFGPRDAFTHQIVVARAIPS